MFWFDGSVRNAVDKVKSSGLFLLVFVQGEDSLSKKYEKYLNEETKFNSEEYVAIKIPHDSVALQQFKEIYISVPIPSIFLIQNNGVPIKVVSSCEVSDIQTAISDAINKQKVKQERKNGGDKMQCNSQSLSQIDNKGSSEVTSKTMQHIKNIGQRINNVSEDEIKNRLKEIRAFPRFWLMPSSRTSDSSSYPESPPPLQSARIQFRLPNDTMPSWEFPDLSTLGDVRAYLMEKLKLSSDFKLLRAYPKTSFTPGDEDKTLAELSLTPSSTLIVVPVQHKTVQAKVKSLIAQKSYLSTLISNLLLPLIAVYNFFKSYFLRGGGSDMNKGPRRLRSDTSIEKVFNKKTSTSNIHGLKFEDDTDSDVEHPDNGNSTQQRFQ